MKTDLKRLEQDADDVYADYSSGVGGRLHDAVMELHAARKVIEAARAYGKIISTSDNSTLDETLAEYDKVTSDEEDSVGH